MADEIRDDKKDKKERMEAHHKEVLRHLAARGGKHGAKGMKMGPPSFKVRHRLVMPDLPTHNQGA